MSRSLSITANFVFKLHIAALQAPHQNVRIYPVMDGFYAAAAGKNDILNFLRVVFAALAETFSAEAENRFRFLAQGGLAFGPSIHGNVVPQACSPVLGANVGYRDSILLGMPMVQAHLSESGAPPFGVFVHESARAFAPAGQEPLHEQWWRWDTFGDPGVQAIWAALQANLHAYFNWCAQRPLRIDYSLDRINAHGAMVDQYFA